jgi:hypothetical protein
MSKEEKLLADTRQFVRQVLTESQGRRPSKAIVDATASKITKALGPSLIGNDTASPESGRGRSKD